MLTNAEIMQIIDDAIKSVWEHEIKSDYNANWLMNEDGLKNALYFHLRKRLEPILIGHDLRIFTEFKDAEFRGKQYRPDMVIAHVDMNSDADCWRQAVTNCVAVIELKFKSRFLDVVLGIPMDGRKDILGVWIGEHESSKFWLNVLNDLKSRGVMDVYLFCTDGLCGMMQATQAVYPKSRLQRCIVHQIRSSTKYVSYKDIRKVIADLKKVYTAVTLDEAEENLRLFGNTWRKQYPSCVKSWEDNWEVLNTFFEYPPEIRKIIYTTNIIEGLNRQFRQITRNKPSFTNDDSLRRMLYLASQRIVRHWRARCQNWDMVLSQLEIMFADRRVG